MSSHFNYEIDERNLSGKLREMRDQYSEQAWQQFEAFADDSRKSYAGPVFPKVRLNLSRNVILPIVFGSAIILLSMLLYNFVSIRKPGDRPAVKDQVPVSAAAKETPSEIKKPLTEPVIADTMKAPVADKLEAPAPPSETVASAAAPASNSTAVSLAESPGWISSGGDIYAEPNIRSRVIGTALRDQSFMGLEETVYFVKVLFNRSGRSDTGFIRKTILSREGAEADVPARKKRRGNRKAEVLESLQLPVSLPTSGNEKEPELK